MATVASAIDRVSYDDLYKRWEKGNWSATEIDFSEDRDEWNNKWSDIQRKAALWNYSLFFHGEDSVTDNLSPYIDAAPREEQKYFLATQQVDEARHSVFFGRFMREVVDRGDTIAGSLAATLPELTWGFRKTFAKLDDVADELREVLPYTTAVLVPPNWDRSYTEVFGQTIEDIFEQGMISLEQKMKSAG